MNRTSLAACDRRRFVQFSAAGAAVVLAGTLPAVSQASETVPAGSYTAGAYQGRAQGRGGEMTVEVVFSADRIESVTVADHRDTARISDLALAQVPAQIVEYQSLGVDTVAGATLSSLGVLNAVTDCVEQAGGDVAALKAAPGAPRSTDEVELTADLVVVGAGSAGMAAAVSAAQNGAQKVVVLEKASNVGGNCLVSGGYLEYIYAPLEMRSEMTDDYREYFAETLQDALDGGADQAFVDALQADFDDYYANGATDTYDSTGLYNIELCMTESGGDCSELVADFPINDPSDIGVQLNEWLTDLGLAWKSPLHAIVGYTWPRWSAPASGAHGEGYFDLFDRVIADEKLPIEVVTCCAATELVVEDGRVVGVKAQGSDGTLYTARGTKGVVLATGGYSGNTAMLKEYNTYWDFDGVDYIGTTNTYGHTGDGIKMAQSVGGFMIGGENPMLFPHADPKDFSTETTVGGYGAGVNREGKRFIDETGSRYAISQAVLEQTGQVQYLISDAVSAGIDENGITKVGGLLAQDLIDEGRLFKADTLAELADLAGIDGAALEQTIAAFNACAKGEAGDEFGRTVFAAPIEQPPFYACPRTTAAHITLGGVVVDDGYRVITPEGDPVEGLYAIGEVTAYESGVYTLGMGMALGRLLFA